MQQYYMEYLSDQVKVTFPQISLDRGINFHMIYSCTNMQLLNLYIYNDMFNRINQMIRQMIITMFDNRHCIKGIQLESICLLDVHHLMFCI